MHPMKNQNETPMKRNIRVMHKAIDMNAVNEASADNDEKVFFYALYFDEQDRSLLLEQRRQLQQDERRSLP